MSKLYIQTKFGLKEILHIDDAAKALKIKPATFTAYVSREQVVLKRIKIKNLIFFYKDDIDELIKLRKESNHKNDHMFHLFDHHE